MWDLANSGLGRLEYIHVVTNHSSIAKKKHARTGKVKRLVRDVLLKPETWKAAVAALDFGLKLVRAVLKGLDYFS